MISYVLKFNVLLLIFVAGFSSCDTGESLMFKDLEKVGLLKFLYYSNSSASKLTGKTVNACDEAGNMIKESFYV